MLFNAWVSLRTGSSSDNYSPDGKVGGDRLTGTIAVTVTRKNTWLTTALNPVFASDPRRLLALTSAISMAMAEKLVRPIAPPSARDVVLELLPRTQACVDSAHLLERDPQRLKVIRVSPRRRVVIIPTAIRMLANHARIGAQPKLVKNHPQFKSLVHLLWPEQSKVIDPGWSVAEGKFTDVNRAQGLLLGGASARLVKPCLTRDWFYLWVHFHRRDEHRPARIRDMLVVERMLFGTVH
ncbi:hypothetical protein R3P38DRAFT_3285464 [Favolaschia claudopus]|uniref:Uncharacterized protein n=1 Tax=Favolaschia claudopus TaxID=2862362 RepID=A0AAW0A3D1_9AGAR